MTLLLVAILAVVAAMPDGSDGGAEPPSTRVAGARQGQNLAEELRSTFAVVPDLAVTVTVGEPFPAPSAGDLNAQTVEVEVIAAHLGMVSTGERFVVVVPSAVGDVAEIAGGGPVLLAATWSNGLEPDELKVDSIVALGASPKTVRLPPEWSSAAPEVAIDTWVDSLLAGQGGSAELLAAMGCGPCGGAPPMLAFSASNVAAAMRTAVALATEASLHR